MVYYSSMLLRQQITHCYTHMPPDIGHKLMKSLGVGDINVVSLVTHFARNVRTFDRKKTDCEDYMVVLSAVLALVTWVCLISPSLSWFNNNNTARSWIHINEWTHTSWVCSCYYIYKIAAGKTSSMEEEAHTTIHTVLCYFATVLKSSYVMCGLSHWNDMSWS